MGNKIEGKMLEYSNIQNNFSGGGSNVYRFGHNISDGNFEYQFCSFDVLHPGWHWATEYETGFFNNQYSGSGLNKQNLPIPSYPADCFNGSNFGADCGYWNNTTWVTCPGEETRRFGAGVHRFFYTNHKNGVDKFSAFTLTINYKNSITDIYCPVKSYNVDLSTNNGTTMVPAFAPPTATANGSVITGVQISGPPPGTEVSEGCYLIEYKFLNGDDISYCGFVLSVSSPSTEFTMDTKTTDALLEIDLDDPALLTLPAKVRHSKEFTIAHHRVNDDITGTSRVAWQVQSVGYDQIEAYINEAASLNAELAIVLNIGTGYPQEAVGLLEYLAEKEQQVAHVELGSELMGFWNKGSVKYPDLSTLTATELGELTLPFARALENSPNAFVSATPVATTSTYNFSIDFPGQASNIETKIEDWLRALTSNGKCYVDLINIHNYPTRDTRLLTFDGDKVDKMLAINQALQDQVLIAVGIGIDQAGLPAGSALGYVLTESNTADLAGTEPYRAQHKTMTEGMFYAESFRLAAAAQFEALTPFAFTKPSYWDPPSNIINGDPLDYYSYNVDDVDNNILFYPNNHSLNYDEIYFRPVYRIKKMIAENLRIHVLGQSVANMPIKDNYINGYGTPVPTPQMAILPTMEADESFVHIMVINRKRSGMPNQMSELKVILDGELVKTAEIMAISANSIDEKNPSIYGSANTGLALNHEDPTFQTAIFGALEGIMIPDFSVSILKVAVPQSVACTNILTPINGAVDVAQGTNVTWEIAPGATGYNVIITNQVGNSTTYSVGLVTSFPLPIQTSCEPVSVTVIPYNAGGPPAEVCPSITFTMVCCSGCQDLTFPQSTTKYTWPPIGYIPGSALGIITVETGATLDIPANARLEFCLDGELLIMPGGVVNLLGTLTSCQDFWKGVNIPDGLNAQGKVYGGFITLGNSPTVGLGDCMIENAKIGINCHFGGFTALHATFPNSAVTFKNCRIGIQNVPQVPPVIPTATVAAFLSKVNTLYGTTYFVVDDDYTIPEPFFAHINLDFNPQMFAIGGFGSVCTFENNMSDPPVINYGVKAQSSSVRINDGNSFYRLTYGVHTGENAFSKYHIQGYPFPPGLLYERDRRMEIQGCTFTDCFIGVFDRLSASNVYAENTFNMGRLPLKYMQAPINNPLRPFQIGIHAESNVWAYHLTLNEFGKTYAGNSSNVSLLYGTNMVNTGQEENTIYKNNFLGMRTANFSSATNGQLNGPRGLMYECNDLDSEWYDFRASKFGSGMTITQPKLRDDQGTTLPGGAFQSAGNCFTDPIIVNPKQFSYEHANQSINYYWKTGTQQNCVFEPTKVTSVNVFTLAGGDVAHGCEIRPVPGLEGSGSSQGLSWTPEHTQQNRVDYFVAKSMLDLALTSEEEAYYTERAHFLAITGYQAVLTDSSQGLDSVLLWLDRVHSFQAELKKAQLLMQNGIIDLALETLNAIPAKFNLSDEEAHDLASVQAVWNIILSITSENRAEKLQQLEQIAQIPLSYGSAQARNTLESEGWYFAPLMPEDEEIDERSILSNFPSSEENSISLYPNPTHDFVRFDLNYAQYDKQMHIELIDALGQSVSSLHLAKDQKTGVLDLTNQQSGFYIFRLLHGNTVLEATQLFIQH
jgi:hypothetical protein